MNELVRLIYLTGRESNPQKGKGENPSTALPAIVAGSVSGKTLKSISLKWQEYAKLNSISLQGLRRFVVNKLLTNPNLILLADTSRT